MLSFESSNISQRIISFTCIFRNNPVLFEIVSFLSCFLLFYTNDEKISRYFSNNIPRCYFYNLRDERFIFCNIFLQSVTIIAQMAGSRSLKKKHASSRPIPTEPRNASVRLSSSFSRMFRSPISPRVHSLFLVLSRVLSSY